MRIETVLGPISPEKAGITLTHEHIKLDYTKAFIEPLDDIGKERARDNKITLKNLGWIRQHPYSHMFNLELHNEGLQSMVDEVKEFKKLGGSTIVEATTGGIAPDWDFLKKVSEGANVHIVCGAGFYLNNMISEEVKAMSVEKLTELITKQVTEGHNGIKAGVIGEVGCSYPLQPAEKKHLIAAVKAQSITGAPLLIHPGRDYRSPKEIMGIIKENGGDVNKTAMSHLDRTIHTEKDLLELAELGCYLEYDFFGIDTPSYQYDSSVDLPSDAQRIKFIKFLIDKGYTDKIVIAHDVHTKHRLIKYGGHGYGHILESAVPKMLLRGISKEEIQAILIDNPKHWLSF